MPNVETVEFVGGSTATITASATSTLDLEVNIESVVSIGAIPPPEAIEVTLLGTLKVPDGGVVYNRGGVTGLIVLAAADPIPAGLPAGTVVLRS